jgi:hypothetical protein
VINPVDNDLNGFRVVLWQWEADRFQPFGLTGSFEEGTASQSSFLWIVNRTSLGLTINVMILGNELG